MITEEGGNDDDHGGGNVVLKRLLVLTPRIIGTGEDPVKRIIILFGWFCSGAIYLLLVLFV